MKILVAFSFRWLLLSVSCNHNDNHRAIQLQLWFIKGNPGTGEYSQAFLEDKVTVNGQAQNITCPRDTECFALQATFRPSGQNSHTQEKKGTLSPAETLQLLS